MTSNQWDRRQFPPYILPAGTTVEPTCPILSIARPSHENDDYIYLRWPQRPRFLGEREGGKRDRDAAVTPSISERSEVGSVRVPRRWLTSLPLLLSHEIDGVRKEKERLTAAKGTRPHHSHLIHFLLSVFLRVNHLRREGNTDNKYNILTSLHTRISATIKSQVVSGWW